jgi:hypothetical protein
MTREMADFELGLYFSENNISHILSVRMKTSTTEDSEEPTSAVGQRIRQSISFKPNMPMLSRQGFIDLMNIEYHKDLDQAQEYLNQAIKAYGIWNGLGAMPRDVLPEKSKSTASKFVKIKSAGSEPPELKSLESKSIESKSTELQPSELKSVAEKEIEAEEAVEKEDIAAQEKKKESELPPPAMPLKLKGGEAKIETLLKKEDFDQESSKWDEPEEQSSPDTEAIDQVDDGGNTNDDEESKSVGALHAKVEEEISETKPSKFDEHDLYKED